MVDSFKVKIPVKTHIRKYYTAIYGDVLRLDANREFDDIILTKLTSRTINHNSAKVFYENNILKKDDHLTISLPIAYLYRFDFKKIPLENQYAVSRFLEKNFRTNLFLQILINQANGVFPRITVKSFLHRYNIDDDTDINPLSLTRCYRREKHTLSNYFNGVYSTLHFQKTA